MDEIKTMRVKPWGAGQGDYVVINEADFDPEKHVPVDRAGSPAQTRENADKVAWTGDAEDTNPKPVARKKKRRKKKTG